MSKTRVFVADDSVVMRQLIVSVVESHPDLEIAGVAANGAIALSKIRQNPPDLITLDIEMPEMDGLAALTEIRRLYPRIPVIMFSTLTQRGAAQTVEALTRGASDYVPKPSGTGSVAQSMVRLREELLPRILALGRPQVPAARTAVPVRQPGSEPLRRGAQDIVAIASSTGGPTALNDVLTRLPRQFPVPILIVQHMPPVFTGLLAGRLNEMCQIAVSEAAEGERFQPGHAYIAPGGKHLEVRATPGGPVAALHEGLPENSCRPAADVLFRSVARIWESRVLAVVLTGMGRDGTAGARAIRDKGGSVIAQDRESSVVWGMPGSVVDAQLASDVLPLAEIGPALAARL